LRANRKQRDKVVGESGIDIVGQDDQVVAMSGDDLGDSVDAGLVHFDGSRVIGIDE